MVDAALTFDDFKAGATGYLLGAATLSTAAALAGNLVVKTTREQATQMRRLLGVPTVASTDYDPRWLSMANSDDDSFLKRLGLGENTYRT
jgi:hypothetical protein